MTKISPVQILSLLVALSTSSPLVFAHGEHSHGPHGGYVRMPGAFHTEVVPEGDRKLKVYLLDIEFKNPTTEKSTLEAQWKDEAKTRKLNCSKKPLYFECRLPKDANLSKGELILKAKRMEAVGGPATYDLPLRLRN